MTLGQLKQIIDKALEECPGMAKTEVRYLTKEVSYPIAGMLLDDRNYLSLIAPELVKQDKLWLP